MDVTADDVAVSGGIPAVKPEVLKQAAQPMQSVLGMAQRQMGAAQWAASDPWVSVKAGVAGLKPHKAQVRAFSWPLLPQSLGSGCAWSGCRLLLDLRLRQSSAQWYWPIRRCSERVVSEK